MVVVVQLEGLACPFKRIPGKHFNSTVCKAMPVTSAYFQSSRQEFPGTNKDLTNVSQHKNSHPPEQKIVRIFCPYSCRNALTFLHCRYEQEGGSLGLFSLSEEWWYSNNVFQRSEVYN